MFSLERVGDPTVLSDLRTMNLAVLKKRAREAGISKETIDMVDDEADPKEAVIEHILAEQASLSVDPILLKELRAMTLNKVKKFAAAKGIDQVLIDNCDENDDPKGAVIQLMFPMKAVRCVGLSGRQYDIQTEHGDTVQHIKEKVARHEHVEWIQVQLLRGDTPLDSLEDIHVGEVITCVKNWPTKTILIMGATGDGKSTLVNNLITGAEQEALVSMNVKGTTKHVREYKCSNNTTILDTPGVGDYDVSVLKLYILLEEALSQKGSGIDYIVVTTALNSGRFNLALQMVQSLVKRGFLENDGHEWDHIIVCGTKKDRAEPQELEAFRSIVDLFFKDAPNKTGAFAMVDMRDISELEKVISTKPTKKIAFQAPGEEELACEFSAKLGFKSNDKFVAEYRKELEAREKERHDIQAKPESSLEKQEAHDQMPNLFQGRDLQGKEAKNMSKKSKEDVSHNLPEKASLLKPNKLKEQSKKRPESFLGSYGDQCKTDMREGFCNHTGVIRNVSNQAAMKSVLTRRWKLFCSHTKQSNKWSCEDFVRDQLWEVFEAKGIPTFYDRVALVGNPITACLEAAACAKVIVVVLDDKAPSPWMLAEIAVALNKGIPVQSIYRQDKFSWEEVGKPAWKHKDISTDVLHGVFARESFKFDCNPLYVDRAKDQFMELTYSLLGYDKAM